MTTALVKKSSGEVHKISLTNQSFGDIDPDFWMVVTDPILPDGTDTSNIDGELGIFGYSKILDADGVTVRNSTQQEIDGFIAYEVDDENQQDANAALELFQNHPQFRKMMIAFADILVDEFNILREWERDFKDVIAAATSLAEVKSGVAALPDLPDRTLAQLKTAIVNRISKDD